MLYILIPIIVIIIIAYFSRESKETLSLEGKSVFISGCDTGFGNGLAIRLDKKGLKVFAGCLTEKGAKELKAKTSDRVETIICDITKQEDIKNVKSIIEKQSPEGLWALVNNAGIGCGAEWEWMPEKYIRSVMDINFFGHVHMTKALLPLLKKSKGRIVNLTSIAGTVTGPGLGIYSCSKFAMESFTDSLRREMKKWGVSVYVVAPGFTATPMINGIKATLQRVWDDVTDEHKTMYGEEYGKAFIANEIPLVDPPELVLDVLESKVTFKAPAVRSRVGKLAAILFIINLLPTSLGDAVMSFLDHYKPGNVPLPAVLQNK